MKIVFECVGFRTNPLFLDRGDDRPLPYGTIIDARMDGTGTDLEFWPENYMPNVVSEEQIRQTYNDMVKQYRVAIFDVSKQAWLEDRFGEVKDCPKLGVEKGKEK
jgi:hypothetical protein